MIDSIRNSLLQKLPLMLVISLTLSWAQAQMDSDFSGGGAIRVGDSTTTCDGTSEGAIRFDADGADTLDFCDGTNWLSLLTSTIGGAIVNNGNSFAAPMVIGTNDSNALSFETNSSVRVTIDTSGNVGVGTTSPASRLHIEGGSLQVGTQAVRGGVNTAVAFKSPSSSDTRIEFNGARGGAGLKSTTLEFYNNVNQISQINAETGSNNSQGELTFYTNNGTLAERMRIDENGNVGIGTDNPANKVEVEGTAAGITVDATSGNASVKITSQIGDRSTIGLQKNNLSRWLLESESTSETGSDAGSNFAIRRYDDAGAFSGTPLWIERATGNVGVGTTSPSKKLQVNGDFSAGAVESYNNSGAANLSAIGSSADPYNFSYINLGNTADGKQWSINYRNGSTIGADAEKLMLNYYNGSTYNDFLTFDSSGNSGIGTDAPAAKLDVAGDVKIGNSSATCDSTTEGSMRYNSTSKWMEFCDGSVWSAIDGADHGFYGGASLLGASNCLWGTTNASWTTLNTADSDCNNFSYDGAASAPSEGKIPAVQFASLPSGRYRVHFNVQQYANSDCLYRIYDGTNHGPATYTHVNGDNYNLFADFVYGSTQTNHTFYVQANRRWGGGGDCAIAADDTDFDLRITVEKID